MMIRDATLTALATILIATTPVLAQTSGQGQEPQSGQESAQGQAPMSETDQGGQQDEATRECLSSLEEVQQERADFRSESVGIGTSDDEFRSLRRAALVFANNGNADGCEMIISEMRDMLEEQREEYQEQQAARTAESTDMTSVGMTDEERYSSATKVGDVQGLLRTDTLIGADIRNHAGEWLGEAETLILNPTEGSVAYVLVAYGGFLGMGEELTPVRWSDFRITSDHETLVLGMQSDQFEQAPSVNIDEVEMQADSDWISDIDSWWDEHIADETEMESGSN